MFPLQQISYIDNTNNLILFLALIILSWLLLTVLNNEFEKFDNQNAIWFKILKCNLLSCFFATFVMYFICVHLAKANPKNLIDSLVDIYDNKLSPYLYITNSVESTYNNWDNLWFLWIFVASIFYILCCQLNVNKNINLQNIFLFPRTIKKVKGTELYKYDYLIKAIILLVLVAPLVLITTYELCMTIILLLIVIIYSFTFSKLIWFSFILFSCEITFLLLISAFNISLYQDYLNIIMNCTFLNLFTTWLLVKVR